MNRRTFLLTAGLGVYTSLSGCSILNDDNNPDSNTTPSGSQGFANVMRFSYQNQFSILNDRNEYTVTCSCIGGFNNNENRTAIRFKYVREESGETIDDLNGRYLFEKGDFYQDIFERGDWTTDKSEFFARVTIPSYEVSLPIPVQLYYNSETELNSQSKYTITDFGNSHYYNTVSALSSRGDSADVEMQIQRGNFISEVQLRFTDEMSGVLDDFEFRYDGFNGNYSFSQVDELDLSDDWPTR